MKGVTFFRLISQSIYFCKYILCLDLCIRESKKFSKNFFVPIITREEGAQTQRQRDQKIPQYLKLQKSFQKHLVFLRRLG